MQVSRLLFKFTMVTLTLGGVWANASPSILTQVSAARSNIGPSTNVLICQAPGSNVAFTFSYVDQRLAMKDGSAVGIRGLAYSSNVDSEIRNYNFKKDPLKVSSQPSSGFLFGSTVETNRNQASVLFKSTERIDERMTFMRRVVVQNARIDFERSNEGVRVFKRIIVELYSDKLVGENILDGGAKSLVHQTVAFTKYHCVGNLTALAE